jgi:hypothetical protein
MRVNARDQARVAGHETERGAKTQSVAARLCVFTPRSVSVRGRLRRPLVARPDFFATFADFACNWLLSVSVSLWLKLMRPAMPRMQHGRNVGVSLHLQDELLSAPGIELHCQQR